MRYCGANTRAGGTCKRPAMRDQNRCDVHGGKSPQALAKAVQRRAEHRARQTLEVLGVAGPVTDPIGELERLTGQAVALVDALRGAVECLEEIRYRGGMGQGIEQVRGELQAYLAAMQRAESLLVSLIKLDLHARRVRIQESQIALLIAAIDHTLGHRDLALPEAMQRRARALLAAELKPATVIEVGR